MLGELSEEEKTVLETKYFSDDQFFHELLEVESDLVDAYVRDEITPSERERFEAALDLFPARREKVEFARALQRVLTRPLVRDIPAWRRMLPLAAAVLLFAAGAAWFTFESMRLRDERAALEARGASLAEDMRRLTEQADAQRARVAELAAQLETQRRTSEATIQPVNGAGNTLRVASFVLAAGMLRGGSGSNAFNVPEHADAIALEVSVEAGGYKTYRAAIQKPSGETILTQRGLRPRKGKSGVLVSVLLSSGDLPSGDYILALSGEKAGGAETVGEYSFRIVH